MPSFALRMPPKTEKYPCISCKNSYKTKKEARSHYRQVHLKGIPNTCFECGATFSRKGDVARHYRSVHINEKLVHQCVLCGSVFYNATDYKNHKTSHQPQNSEFKLLSSAFRKNCVIYRKTYSEKMETFDKAFLSDKDQMEELLKYEVNMKKSSKASIIWIAEFYKPLDLISSTDAQTCVLYLRTSTAHLCNVAEVDVFIRDARNVAQQRIDDFVENGSGWVLDEILSADIEIGSCAALNGSCNLLTIHNVKSLQRIKPFTKRQQCFFEAIAYHFVKKENYYALSKFIGKKIIQEIDTPVKVSDVTKFERDNHHLDIKINILYAEDTEIYPLLVSKKGEVKHTINLLLWKTVINGEVVSHYSYIDNLSNFLKKVYRRKTGKECYLNGVSCPNCLSHFGAEKSFQKHFDGCKKNKPQAVIIPEKPNNILRFTKFNKKFKVPLIGFFDFEADQSEMQNECETCAKKGNTEECRHKTKITAIQNPITYSMIILNERNEIVEKKTYSGKDCVENLFDTLLSIENRLLRHLKQNVPMRKLTPTQLKEKENAVNCHICERQLGDDRVVDHDHLTSEFIGMAHADCNLNRQTPMFIPMFCHNLQGYDSHFLIKGIQKDERIRKIEALPYNTERFKTITLNSYVFLDSMAFLSASLNDIVNNLTKTENHPFNVLDQMQLYDKDNIDMKKLLIRKGVYPYDFAESLQLLKETKELPPIKKFYSKLSNSTISDDDYNHAKKVFTLFECKNMLDYTELYCATDTALLAEVMLQFREEVYNQFKLDCW